MISITQTNKTPAGWEFEVRVKERGPLDFQVSLAEKYWERFARHFDSPAEMVEKSFSFLLEREPKESILKKFDLETISKYFPEYEEEIIKE